MKKQIWGKKYAFNNIKTNELLLSTQQNSNITEHKSNYVNQKLYFDPFSYRDHVTFRKYSFHKLKQNSSFSKQNKKSEVKTEEAEQMIDLIQHLKLWKQIKTNRNQILVKSYKNGQSLEKMQQKQEDQIFLRHKKLNQLQRVVNKEIYHLNKLYLREYLVNKKQFVQQYSQLNAKSSVKIQLNNIKKLIQTVQKEENSQKDINKQLKVLHNKKCFTEVNQEDKKLLGKVKNYKAKLKTQTNQTLKRESNNNEKNNTNHIDNESSGKIRLQRKPISLLNFKKQNKYNQLKQIDQHFQKQTTRIENQIVSKYRRDVNYKLSYRQPNAKKKLESIISQTTKLRRTQV